MTTTRIKGQDYVSAWLLNHTLLFIQAWTFMLAVGIAHAQWWPQIPTIGYWWSVLLLFLVRGSFSMSTVRQTAESRERSEERRKNKALADMIGARS